MKKIKMMLMTSAFIVALAGAFAFSMPAGNGQDTVVYHYDSDSPLLVDMQDIDNWKVSGPSCTSSGNIPCAIEFNGDRTAFESYLGEFEAPEDITAAADEKRTVVP